METPDVYRRPSCTSLSQSTTNTSLHPTCFILQHYISRLLPRLIRPKTSSSSSSSSSPRSHMFVMESLSKNRQYNLDIVTSSGKKLQLTLERSHASNGNVINVVDDRYDIIVMRVMMDLKNEDFTLIDWKNDRVFRFSKARNFYAFSWIRSGFEIPLAQVIPKNCATKADVTWIRANELHGQKVAELSRPLFNRRGVVFGLDFVKMWFHAGMEEMVAIGLQLCFMCIPRFSNRPRLRTVKYV